MGFNNLRDEESPSSILPRIAVLAGQNHLTSIRQQGLFAKGFACSLAQTVAEAQRLVFDQKPDLLLLAHDWGQVELQDVIVQIRAVSRTQYLPIVLWDDAATSPSTVDQRENVVDDVISSQIRQDRATAVLRAVLRRTRPMALTGRLEISALVMNEFERRVEWAGKPIHLSPTEYRFLAALTDEPSHMLRHSEIRRRIWGASITGHSATLNHLVKNLRYTLRSVDAGHLIATVYAVGYRIETVIPPESKGLHK